jgi:hypothetical protein
MARLSLRTFLPAFALPIAGASVACGSDSVAGIVYPGDDGGGGAGSSGGSSSGIASGTSTGSSGGSSSGIVSGTSTGSSSGTSSESSSGSSSGVASGSDGGSSGGAPTCDMTGYWIAVQHSVAVSDGFKEIGRVYFYYDLSQNGDTVKVNHGLHCGINVAKDPANLLGGGDSVSLPLAGAANLARQDEGQAYGSVPARTGTMTKTPNGSACQFKFNKYYVVRGATIPYYLDPSHTMSTSMPVAMGCGPNFSNCQTPGSEDWDNDGNPGVTLAVSGTATGNIYAAQRDFSEYNGIVPLGATKFEVGAVDSSGNPAVGPEQYALNYGNGCSAICGLSSMLDTCPSSGCAAEYFVDWVKLGSPPASNNTDICTYVINNAQRLAPRATDPNSVPTEPKYQ